MLQFLGLVHVHEEVLQQPLSLRQVVCIHLLVNQGEILLIAIGVLQRSQRSVNENSKKLQSFVEIDFMIRSETACLITPVLNNDFISLLVRFLLYIV